MKCVHIYFLKNKVHLNILFTYFLHIRRVYQVIFFMSEPTAIVLFFAIYLICLFIEEGVRSKAEHIFSL